MATRAKRLSIPDSEVAGFKQIANTERDLLQALANAISDQEPSLDPEVLAEGLAKTTGLPFEDVNRITRVIWGWALVQRRIALSTDEFIEAVTTYLHGLPDDTWTQEDRDGWEPRQPLVRQLLAPESSLTCGAKALDLLLEQHLVFWGARTITDVRPVFDENADSVQALLPFHSLIIRYFESGEPKEIHFAMDSNDVRILRSCLDRAEKKEALLKQELARTGFVVINTGSESGI